MKNHLHLWSVCVGLGLAGLTLLPLPAAAQTADDGSALSTEERLARAEERIRELERKLEQLMGADNAAPESESPKVAAVKPETEFETAESEPLYEGDLGEEVSLVGDIRETHELLSGQELASSEFPSSWPMFGSDMRMKIGGYVKADFVADFDGTRDATQFLMATIPVPGQPDYGDSGYVSLFAKETRFNIDVRRIRQGSPPLRAFIEGDFFSSSSQFRLRHAYMTVGDYLAGQTWTTLTVLESLPFMIDFAAGDALFGSRTTQLRYQRRLNDGWKLSLALEEIAFLGIDNPNGLPGEATRQLPLFAARADYRWDSGMLVLGASLAQLHWDGGSSGPSDSATQYAFLLAGRQNLGQRSYASWNISYGEGSGENVMAFAGSNANAVLNAEGNLETIPAFAAVLGYGYNWNANWSSNLSYAYGWLDTPPSRDAFALKRGGIGHVNLIWKPVSQFSTGAEFMWGVTRVENDALGKAQRLQLMAKYEF